MLVGPSKLWLKKLVAYDGMGCNWNSKRRVIAGSVLAGNMIRYDNVQAQGIALLGNASVPGGASDASSRNGLGQSVDGLPVATGTVTVSPTS
jgi:hypothetical protein